MLGISKRIRLAISSESRSILQRSNNRPIADERREVAKANKRTFAIARSRVLGRDTSMAIHATRQTEKTRNAAGQASICVYLPNVVVSRYGRRGSCPAGAMTGRVGSGTWFFSGVSGA